jgi:signal transduction histidine kinase
MPRLADFIRSNTSDILAAWEAFARELPIAATMDVAALRDHARDMLDVIARDLETTQSESERADKSRGAQPKETGSGQTAAGKHGFGRAESGFHVEVMIAEFRALRASVIRLWRARQERADAVDLEDLTRFNEAIDQAVAESVAQYMRQVETTRDRFLAVLGHDLRSPLSAIVTSTQFLQETADLTPDQQRLVGVMETSSARMKDLIKDLLDLAVTRLGDGMPTKREEMDIGVMLREVVDEALAASPEARIELECSGSLAGSWDHARLSQAFSNLVGNALQHGSKTTPVRITAKGDHQEKVVVAVSNVGPPIPADRMGGIFGAMKGNKGSGDRRHRGLGLYIVDKIIEAHGGAIEIRSSEGHGTTFTVSLPRRAK